MIHQIKANDLRSWQGKEGLILQGCGGDPQEWLNGINDLFKQQGILKYGEFKDCYVFQNTGLTNILLPFDDTVELDVGKLSAWRLESHFTFGGTWLSDYVQNRLGGFTDSYTHRKPECPLIGQDGNIFNLIGIAQRTLRENNMPEAAKEMTERVMSSGSYYESLNIISQYVEITSVDDMGDDMSDQDGSEGMCM